MDDAGAPITQTEEGGRKPDSVLRAPKAIAIIVVFFVVQLGLGVAVGIGTAVYVFIAHGKAAASAIASATTMTMLPSAIVGVVIAAFVAYRMTRRVLTGPIRSGGMASIGWRKAVPFETAMAALAGCGLSLFYIFVLVRISPATVGQHLGPLATSAVTGGWPRHLWAILALFLAPPTEEFVFRGVLLEGLSNSMGVKAAAAIVTVAFVFVHVTETLAYWPAWAALSLVAGAALFFRLKTGSLVPAIGVHFAYNLGLVVISYAGAA